MSLYNKHTACIYYILYTSILWYIFYSGNSPGFGDKGPFLSVVLHESGTRKALLAPWLNDTDVYLNPLFVLEIIQLEDNLLYHIYILWHCDTGFSGFINTTGMQKKKLN
jgi:hypothetical protein